MCIFFFYKELQSQLNIISKKWSKDSHQHPNKPGRVDVLMLLLCVKRSSGCLVCFNGSLTLNRTMSRCYVCCKCVTTFKHYSTVKASILTPSCGYIWCCYFFSCFLFVFRLWKWRPQCHPLGWWTIMKRLIPFRLLSHEPEWKRKILLQV